MNRLAFTVLVTLAIAAHSASEPPKAQKIQVQLNGHTFTLPAGFEIELVAGPPLVDRPIVADFDELGRLYVADSSGSNDNVDQQLKKKPHRILRLEDTDGDGRFDRRTVFADKMMFPEGALWFAGSLYVAAPPSIWKLTDTNGDGVADQRIEWFQGKTLTRCANDLHGPYLGPDGWIYWCKGAFAKQTHERPGKPPFVTRAAHIFRCRPDGSGIEAVMTGGMDNPVEVVFTPGGERIFTTTFLQHPGGGRRDGLIHAIYGGIYGKEHDPINEHKWTGPRVMPVLTHFGPAAPAGLVRYESSVFGPEFKGNLFAALFNMHKVTRHILQPSGATFETRDEDFLISDNLDFHPTDVLEDADGSLLVIDTGGWYKLCCPSSQLHKPDILGAIYRVRRKGAPQVMDPRGLKIAWQRLAAAELGRLLDDPRPAVRRRAVQLLATKNADAVSALDHLLSTATSTEARCNAVWTATRIDLPDARALVRQALDDTDETVRQAAIHSVSIWRDQQAVPRLLTLVKGPSAQNQRAAAEALGRIGDKSAVPVLLSALGESSHHGLGSGPVAGTDHPAATAAERVLEHSLIYALIEIADRETTTAGLRSANPRVVRAALIALDQMDGGSLELETVASRLGSVDPSIKETAAWIAGHHVEWGDGLAGFYRERLKMVGLTEGGETDLVHQLARFSGAAAIQKLLAERLSDPASNVRVRRLVLEVMAQSGLKQAPAVWLSALSDVLAGTDVPLAYRAANTVRALPLPKEPPGQLVDALLHIANEPGLLGDVRLTALAAIPGGLPAIQPANFTLLCASLNKECLPATRARAADILSRAKLTSDQLVALTESMSTIGPMEIDRVLEAFAQSQDERVGRALLAALTASPARAALRVETLKPRLAKFGAPVQALAQELYAALDVDTNAQRAKLEQLLSSLSSGDIRRGQAVFNGTKAACSSCHAVGYLGGRIGPDLTKIGSIRSERDLLEAIVFPSASLVRSYEPVAVTTKNGKLYNGLIKKDAPDELTLVLTADQEIRIARKDIEDVQPSKISIMPAGLDQQLTSRDLADLVAFLKACK
jgi:putative membrane-bound dehydrogenase-like protein